MTIAKEVSRDTVRSGELLQFIVRVEVLYNTATNLVVTDVLPEHVSFDSFTTGYPPGSVAGNTITWTFPALDPGVYTLAYQVRLDDFLASGLTIRNHAEVTHDANPTPREAEASATVIGDYTVRVGVYNAAGELVKEVLVQDFTQPMENVEILNDDVIDSVDDRAELYYRGFLVGTWDGTNQQGMQVANGQYTVKIDNIDSFGVVQSLTQEVTVNRPTSLVQITVYNSTGEVVRRLEETVAGPQDLITSATLSTTTIQPGFGTLPPGAVGEVAIVLSNGEAVVWDGRNDDGMIVANGQYYIEVRAQDGNGAETVITREVAVLAVDGNVGEVVAAPNPVLSGEAGTKFLVKSPEALTLRVSVYNTAGELVKKMVGLGGTNEAWWGTADHANGLYIAVVEVIRPGAGVIDRQIEKVMILREAKAGN